VTAHRRVERAQNARFAASPFAGLVLLGHLVWTAAPAAPPQANSNADMVSFSVDWHAHLHGAQTVVSKTGSIAYPGSETITSVITADMTGSAIVRYRKGAYYDITYGAINLQRHAEQWQSTVVTYPTRPGVCFSHTAATLVDPATYSGFHADVQSSGITWALISNADPTRYRSLSYRIGDALAPLFHMAFTMRSTQEWSGLCAQQTTIVKEWKQLGYAPPTGSGYKNTPGEFKADSADRSSFSLNARWSEPYYNYFPVSATTPVDVTWTAHAYRMGKCAERDGPIPETDPIVTTEDVHIDADDADITPDGKTKLHVKVTCDGVPVEGANVVLTVDPVDSSGGHIHVNDRPHGKLNGTNLTSANPSITLPTDQNGTVKGANGITFAPPGKEPISRCLGLAGDYKVTATSQKFNDRKESTLIKVGLNNLTMLRQGQNYDICADSVHGCSPAGPWGTPDHPESEYGTTGTIQAFQNVATDFWNQQEAHNQLLQACGVAPWTKKKVSFNDIALPWGGLFDMNSTWAQPHKTHGKGQGGDFNHFKNETCSNANGQVIACLSCGGATVNLNTFLWSVLKNTAQPKYGHWDGEVNTNGELHLHVEDQGQGPPSSCPADN
jgi:hypothetical protein